MNLKFRLIFLLTGICSFMFVNEVLSQNNKFYYEYENSDGIESVELNTPAEVQYKEWESNNFLFEYHVKVSNIPRATYLSLLKTPRYTLKKEQVGDKLKVYVDPAAFRIFKSSSGQADENLVLTVFYPSEFTPGNNALSR